MKKINYCFIALLITLGANADQRSYWSLSAGWAQPGDTEIYNANRNHIGDLEFDADIGVVGQDTVLAAQFGAGICYPLDDESCLSLEYRFFVAEDLQDEGGDIELDSQNFQIGYTRYY